MNGGNDSDSSSDIVMIVVTVIVTIVVVVMIVVVVAVVAVSIALAALEVIVRRSSPIYLPITKVDPSIAITDPLCRSPCNSAWVEVRKRFL